MARRKYLRKPKTGLKRVDTPCCGRTLHMHIPRKSPGCKSERCYQRIIRTHKDACPFCEKPWKIDVAAYR